MTFKDIKIGTILYEVITEKSHFDIVERTVDSVSHTEKKAVFSLCPKEGFKDWVYHAYNNRNRVPSKQGYLIFTTKFDALQWFKDRLQKEIDFLDRRRKGAMIQLKSVETSLAREATQYTSMMSELLRARTSYDTYKLWMDMMAASPIIVDNSTLGTSSNGSNYSIWL